MSDIIQLMQSAASEYTKQDCSRCEWKIMAIPEDGHCYMFDTEVAHCEQYNPIKED